MNKPMLVLALTPSGDVAIPLQATDLLPISKDATLTAMQTALVAAIGALPQPNTKVTQVTVALGAAVVDQPVNLGTLTHVETVVVKNLANTTATLKFGAVGEAAVPLVTGESRSGLNMAALYLNSPGAAGGTITLELQGR
jgi:hypothetical protein